MPDHMDINRFDALIADNRRLMTEVAALKAILDPDGKPAAPPASDPSVRRPPCALMTASAAMHADCAALRKLTEAGMEVVVVQDADIEASLRIAEKVRRETANASIERPIKPQEGDMT